MWLSALPTWLPATARVLLIAGIVGLVWLYGDQQRQSGYNEAELAWQQRSAQDTTTQLQQIIALQTDYIHRERRVVSAFSDIASKALMETNHVRNVKNRKIADLRAGTLQLRIPIAPDTCGDHSGTSGAATSPGSGDATPRAQLSDEAAEFLVGLATEADEVVLQLQACQQILQAERQMSESYYGP